MADTHVLTNTYMCYIKNGPYHYPEDEESKLLPGAPDTGVTTGWHILPNMLWRHFVTPKQFAELQIKYEAYKVDGIKIQIFNMVPMTHQIAIQGTSVFTAFNNTIYAWGYTDDIYETAWHNWYSYEDPSTSDLNLMYKEGLQYKYNTTTKHRFDLPVYKWKVPNSRATTINTYAHYADITNGSGVTGTATDPPATIHLGTASKPNSRNPVFPTGETAQSSDIRSNFNDRPTGVLWDPLNRSDHIMEMRPGKNTLTFSWSTHESDSNKWFNMDLLAWWYPYTTTGPYHSYRQRPQTGVFKPYCDPDRLCTRFEYQPPLNDYTIPNWANVPVVPCNWWWHEIKNSVLPYAENGTPSLLHYMDMFFCGTESECYKYPPTQMFVKMIPLFDQEGTLIETSANISVKTELIVSGKPRKSAYYAPTWGPFDWRALYSGKSKHRFYEPAKIRYRTGGQRRTWQNRSREQDDHGSFAWNTLARTFAFPREVPLDQTVINAGDGIGGTFGFSRQRRAIRKPTRPSAPPMDVDPSDPMYQQSSLHPHLQDDVSKHII